MIRFFKSSFFIQYLSACLTGLILWGRAFWEPPQMPLPEGYVPLYTLLCSWVSEFPLIRAILGFILVVGTAIYINRIFYRHNIVQKNSSLTAFIFIVLMSYYPHFLVIHPVNIAVFFLVVILSQLFRSYNKTEPLDYIYSTGFFIAIGSFFYFPLIFFYLFILVSFAVFQTMNWRALVSSLFGLLTPFLFLVAYYFWFDKLHELSGEYAKMFSVSIDLMALKKPVYLSLTSVITLFSLYSAAYAISGRTEKTIEKKRKNILVNWIMLFVLISFPFSSSLSNFHIELAFVAFSGLTAFYLLQIRKTFWQELILVILIIFVFINNSFLRLL
jgi:hypothetical protein